jgi:hypothetical protein
MKKSLFLCLVLFLFVQISLGDTLPVYPPDGARMIPTTVIFKWNAQSLPDYSGGYGFIISTKEFAWNIPIDSSRTKFYHPGRDTTFTLTLNPGTFYWWQIKGVKYTPPWSFATKAGTSVLPSASRISIPVKSSQKCYDFQGRIISKPTSNHLHIFLKH